MMGASTAIYLLAYGELVTEVAPAFQRLVGAARSRELPSWLDELLTRAAGDATRSEARFTEHYAVHRLISADLRALREGLEIRAFGECDVLRSDLAVRDDIGLLLDIQPSLDGACRSPSCPWRTSCPLHEVGQWHVRAEVDFDAIVLDDLVLRVAIVTAHELFVITIDTNTGTFLQRRSYSLSQLLNVPSFFSDVRCKLGYATNGALAVGCWNSLSGVNASVLNPLGAQAWMPSGIGNSRIRDVAPTRNQALALVFESGGMTILGSAGQTITSPLGSMTQVASADADAVYAVDSLVLKSFSTINGAPTTLAPLGSGQTFVGIGAGSSGIAVAVRESVTNNLRVRRFAFFGGVIASVVVPFAAAGDVLNDTVLDATGPTGLALTRGSQGYVARMAP